MSKCKGLVTRIILDKYYIKDEDKNEYIEASIRGNVKKKGSILVGDIVEYEYSYDKNVITNVLDRKNQIIRPPVANIDKLIIVVSASDPKPDYILLDKQIILCKQKNIIPVICVNKIDLANLDKDANEQVKYIKEVYTKLGINVIFLSAKTSENIGLLKKELEGYKSAFSGNSAVGKSSITKLLIKKEDELKIGNLAVKTKRGKHTTKYVKLYEIGKNTYIYDTPGFSSYEIFDLLYKELKNYYDDFLNFKCDYDDCMHINEGKSVCRIKENVECGIIDAKRYDRYRYIFSELKEKYDRRYK